MRILNFGSLNIDHVYRVDAFVRPGETKTANSLLVNCGGKGLNQSIAAARAGAAVYHAATVGTDADMLLAALADSGVDVSLTRPCGDVSGHAIIQVDDAGQNCILLHGGANRRLSEAYIDETLATFGTDGLVLAQNETNLVGTIFEQAHRRGLTTAFNAAPMDADARAVPLELMDLLIVNEVEGRGIAGCERDGDILPALAACRPRLNVLLTLGARGACCRWQGETFSVGSYPVKPVDTTAAGDTFTGYFLAGLLRGAPVPDALAQAAAAAALCVLRSGASASVPYRAEVEQACLSGALGTMGAFA